MNIQNLSSYGEYERKEREGRVRISSVVPHSKNVALMARGIERITRIRLHQSISQILTKLECRANLRSQLLSICEAIGFASHRPTSSMNVYLPLISFKNTFHDLESNLDKVDFNQLCSPLLILSRSSILDSPSSSFHRPLCGHRWFSQSFSRSGLQIKVSNSTGKVHPHPCATEKR